ncbi:MAG TPA: Veg protein [Clostridia bacterium]|nr:Veg protein [Clostridia bacterium]
MAAKEVLASIKSTLDDYVGHRIKLRANRGRKKVYERTGVLEKTYPHIFVIKLDEHHSVVRRVSFSYADVLTETVELTVYRGGKEQKIKAVKS